MTDELQALKDWVEPLLAKLSRSERRQLTRRVARDLRRSQAQRIESQRNPDGIPYAPRKPQNRRKQGAIRLRAMSSEIRTAKYMKIKIDSDGLTVGFTGRVAKIARDHQEGRTAMVNRNGPRVAYPARRLLGFAGGDVELVRSSVLRHIMPID